MLSTRYLYDCDPSEFRDLPYEQALRYKRTKAKELIDRLSREIVKARGKEDYFLLWKRQTDAIKARQWCDQMLRELEGEEVA